jgi:hypothetical protein
MFLRWRLHYAAVKSERQVRTEPPDTREENGLRFRAIKFDRCRGFSRVSTDDANRIGTERARAQKHVGGIEMSPTPYNSSRCSGVSQSRVQHDNDDDDDDDDDEGQRRVTPTRFGYARARAIGVPREQSERSAVNQTERQRQRETMQFTRLTGRIRA